MSAPRARSLASVVAYEADRVANNVHDDRWSTDAGCVIDGMGLCLRLHALRHVALRVGHDHSIVLGDEKPTRKVPPKRARDRNSNAIQRYRPLHRGEDGSIVGGRVLRKRRLEGS